MNGRRVWIKLYGLGIGIKGICPALLSAIGIALGIQ